MHIDHIKFVKLKYAFQVINKYTTQQSFSLHIVHKSHKLSVTGSTNPKHFILIIYSKANRI